MVRFWALKIAKVILFMVCIYASLQAKAVELIKEFGSWSVFINKKGGETAALTMNAAQNVLSYRCSANFQMCLYRLDAKIECEHSNQYPMLASTGDNAYPISGYCDSSSNGNYLDLTPVKEIDQLVKQGSVIGFAIPMESGMFKVIRFKLDGSTKAIEFAEVSLKELADSEFL